MTGDRRRIRVLATALVLFGVAGGCSDSREVGLAGTTTTLRLVGDDRLGTEGNSASAQKMQEIIDQLLASDNACDILTQRALVDVDVDPTALLSGSARRVLAQGIVAVYDHLIELVSDPLVQPALRTQSATYAQVLEVVDRYSISPGSARAGEEIKALSEAPEYVAASKVVEDWVRLNCR